MTDPNSPYHDADAALAVERDRVIARLSRHFAVDELSIEELDARIERAYQARSIAELATVTAGLALAHPPAVAVQARSADPYAYGAAVAHQGHHEQHGRLLSIMSTLERGGLWFVPRNLEIASIMSETKLDLREAQLAPGVTDIQIFGLMTSVVVTVLPGVRVVDHTSPFMAESRNETLEDPSDPNSPYIVRLRGMLVMSELVVRALEPGEKPRKKKRKG